jgi:hypothetical protein
MPLTPLHIFPGLAAKIAGGRHFSLTAYIISNVLIDVEPAFKFVTGSSEPLHTLHSPEAGLVFAVAATLASVLPPFRNGWVASVLGAVVGIVTHLFLDGLYHYEVAENLGVAEMSTIFPRTLLEIWLALGAIVFGELCYKRWPEWRAEAETKSKKKEER